MRQADVTVIGAGVMGAFHAYFAAKRGLRVLLIERNAFPADASTRNFGMVAQTLVHPESDWAPVARATAEVYLEVQRQADISVRQNGSIYIASTEAEDAVLREFAAGPGAAAYPCTYIERAEALARFPYIQEGYCRGVLLFPDDLTLDPRRMLRALIPFMRESLTVEYLPNTTIVGVEPRGAECAVTDTEGNVYASGTVFVCCGVQFGNLFPARLRASGLRLCKLQMMRTRPLLEVNVRHAVLSGLSIARYPAFSTCPSYTQLATQPVAAPLREFGIHLLFKQAIDGTITVGDSHEYPEWQAAGPLLETTNPAINDAILTYARGMLCLPDWHMEAYWNGYYLTHPTQDIYVEMVDASLHVVCAGGKGMTLSPGFARQQVDRITGVQKRHR
jgi:FAD dependent oxidoreductase TIGR03364